MASSARHTVVVDWDGTAVEEKWPRRPQEFLPGFVRSMHAFRAAGAHVVISSCRISPLDPKTGELRPEQHVAEEVAYIRELLDRNGLEWVDIWQKPGKPPGAVYVDDKAERFEGSWARTANRTLSRLKATRPRFPVITGSIEEEHVGASD